MKKYIFGSIIFAVVLLYIGAAFDNHSRNAAKNEGCRVELFVDAYEVMVEYLADESLLPAFDNAGLVEEALFLSGLSEKSSQTVASLLNDRYPYTVFIFHGHERFDSNSGTAYIYLTDAVDYKGFNKVRIDGFVNNNADYIMMYFTRSSDRWRFLGAELYHMSPDGTEFIKDRTWSGSMDKVF